MKGKLLILVVLVMAGLVALGSRQDAQASHGAGSAMENVYASLSAGEVDAALASFAEGASAENRVRAEFLPRLAARFAACWMGCSGRGGASRSWQPR